MVAEFLEKVEFRLAQGSSFLSGNDGLGAGEEKGAFEAGDSLFAKQLSGTGFAGGNPDDIGFVASGEMISILRCEFVEQFNVMGGANSSSSAEIVSVLR